MVRVSIIKEKNKMESDSLTYHTAKSNIAQNINTILGEKIEKVEITEDTLTWICRKELLDVINIYLKFAPNQENQTAYLQNYIISSNLDSLMSRQQLEYMTFSIHEGFKRTKENLTAQNLKGLGIGLLTLGMAVPTPVPQNSFFVSIVADKKKKKIAFINYNSSQTNPLELNTTYTQFCKLYSGILTFENNGQCYHN
jgi:hypothetical protein